MGPVDEKTEINTRQRLDGGVSLFFAQDKSASLSDGYHMITWFQDTYVITLALQGTI